MYVNEPLTPELLFDSLGKVIKLSRAIGCSLQDAILLRMFIEKSSGPNKDVWVSGGEIIRATGLTASDWSRAKTRINNGGTYRFIGRKIEGSLKFEYQLKKK